MAVTITSAAQRPGTGFVEIQYDITGVSVAVDVRIRGSHDGGVTWTVPMPPTSLSGAIGTVSLPRPGLMITWDAGTSWPARRSEISFMISVLGPSAGGVGYIPAGRFFMGDSVFGTPPPGTPPDPILDAPVHLVFVSAFYMAQNLTTKREWDTVRSWGGGGGRGYTDLSVGSVSGSPKPPNHPVYDVTWFDAVKWCNARSEQEGLTPCYQVGGVVMRTGETAPTVNWTANGYRLPTEAEWEKAARGGSIGRRFPWGDTIRHSQANYFSDSSYWYDLSLTPGYHPDYDDHTPLGIALYPFTSPVGDLPRNGYGLYDMVGNLWQWCWDPYGPYVLSPGGTTFDPRGVPVDPTVLDRVMPRVQRGSSWTSFAPYCRVAVRHPIPSDWHGLEWGFRVARSNTGPIQASAEAKCIVDTRQFSRFAFRGYPFEHPPETNNASARFAAVGLPEGLSLNPETGIISGIPTTLGIYSITFSTIDAGGTKNETFTLPVILPPILSIHPKSGNWK